MGKILLGIFLIIMLIIFLAEGGEKINSAEFDSMSSCLANIKQSSGQRFDKLIKDTPDMVNGFLSSGRQFNCEKKETGSKGTYYLGTYWK